MKPHIRIAIVDDHALMRAGFRAILSAYADIEIVGEGASGEEALALVREKKPDVLLLDISMPGMSGIDVTQRLMRSKSATRVAIVTQHAEGPLPKLLLENGAAAYLTKGCPSDELLAAVRKVARGERYVDTAIAQRLAIANTQGERCHLDALTARELEVALMVGRGDRSTEIAKRLSIGEKTVHTYKARVYAKLGVDSDPAIALILVRFGLISL